MKRHYIVLIILGVLLLQNITVVLPAQYTEYTQTSMKDFVRGMEVDFEPPELLTLSGSYFTLDVELTKIRPRPLFFSLGVFLKTEDEYGRDVVTRIGCCPYVHIPLNQLQDEVVVSVPCFTTTGIVEQLSDLNGAKDVEICDAEIGVKVEKIWQWGFSDLFWKYCMNDDGAVVKKFILENNGDLYLRYFSREKSNVKFPLTHLRILSFLGEVNSFLLNCMSPRIVWRDTNVTAPLLCSDGIVVKRNEAWCENATDKEGCFNLSFWVKNTLDCDVMMLVTTDAADKPIINTLIPSFEDAHYNVGHQRFLLKSGESRDVNMSCFFPDGGIFSKKNYTTTTEFAPYIPIEKNNQYGVLFYNIRWYIGVKLHYTINKTVANMIEEYWYNIPIFSKTSQSLFQSEYNTVYYQGDAPRDFVDKAMGMIDDKIDDWMLWFFLGCCGLISLFLVGYWFVKNNLKQE